ncbi:hypothetical protein CCP3SC15_910009 [Gammaproteobacteria bacterium]
MTTKATVTISATESGIIYSNRNSIIRLDFPTMTGTAITIKGSETGVSSDGVTIGDQDASLSIASPSGRSVTLAPFLTYGYQCLRLVSNASESTPRLIDVYLQDYLG